MERPRLALRKQRGGHAMVRILHVLVLVVYFILPLDVSASTQAQDSDYIIPVSQSELKIMSYNVQNLFDAEHDSGKKDYEFLPKDSVHKRNCYAKDDRRAESCAKMDWTAEKVRLKLAQTKKAIDAQGSLPDILVLSEVENPSVVGMLADELGYDAFEMTESPDERGIDCAILYKVDKIEPLDFYELEVSDTLFPTRNLSALTFKLSPQLGGGVFAVFANHWPSQRSPTLARILVANALRDLVDEVRGAYGKTEFNYIITGDFNTLDSENPNPIGSVLLDPKWSASLANVRDLAKKAKSPMIPKMPPATYFYGVKSEWNELDRFFINSGLYDRRGLDVDPLSYRIHAPSLVSKLNKRQEFIPFRYNHNSTNESFLGFSDHFAIVVKLRYN